MDEKMIVLVGIVTRKHCFKLLKWGIVLQKIIFLINGITNYRKNVMNIFTRGRHLFIIVSTSGMV